MSSGWPAQAGYCALDLAWLEHTILDPGRRGWLRLCPFLVVAFPIFAHLIVVTHHEVCVVQTTSSLQPLTVRFKPSV